MISTVIADDHALVREGIRSLLERAGDVEVVGEASDGEQAVRLVRELKPDLLLIDLSMPRLNGIEALQRLREENSTTRVLVISMHKDESIVLRALRAGAKSYLLKESFKEELYFAVRSAARGEIYLSPKLAGMMLNGLIAGNVDALPVNPLSRLSGREREVMQLILEGNTNRKMAEMLSISVKTVDKHRTNLMRKLNVHDVSGLMHIAIKNGALYER
jgi:DNA-binding NarL/FixJ family response regulator